MDQKQQVLRTTRFARGSLDLTTFHMYTAIVDLFFRQLSKQNHQVFVQCLIPEPDDSARVSIHHFIYLYHKLVNI